MSTLLRQALVKAEKCQTQQQEGSQAIECQRQRWRFPTGCRLRLGRQVEGGAMRGECVWIEQAVQLLLELTEIRLALRLDAVASLVTQMQTQMSKLQQFLVLGGMAHELLQTDKELLAAPALLMKAGEQ